MPATFCSALQTPPEFLVQRSQKVMLPHHDLATLGLASPTVLRGRRGSGLRARVTEGQGFGLGSPRARASGSGHRGSGLRARVAEGQGFGSPRVRTSGSGGFQMAKPGQKSRDVGRFERKTYTSHHVIFSDLLPLSDTLNPKGSRPKETYLMSGQFQHPSCPPGQYLPHVPESPLFIVGLQSESLEHESPALTPPKQVG
jgi:hypothetical protein